MSYAAQEWAIKLALPPTHKAVLMVLAYRANDDNQSWPSVGLLSRDTCLSERSVQNSLGFLSQAGLVDRIDRSNDTCLFTLQIGAEAPSLPAKKPRQGVQQMHPPSEVGVQDVHPRGAGGAPGGAGGAPLGVQVVHPNIQLTSKEHPLNIHGEIAAIKPTIGEQSRPVSQSPDTFDEWWKHYPKKTGKDAARRAYASALRRGASPADLLAGLGRTRWSSDPRYIAHPATWLNGGRWQDEPDAPLHPNIVTFARPKSHAERVRDRYAFAAAPIEDVFGDLWGSRSDEFRGPTVDVDPIAAEG